MADTADTQRSARRRRHAAIRDEVADKESEAAEAEAAESRVTLDVPMHLRIDKELDDYLHERATREGIAVSALVRQML